jgi:hypothetical protein
VKHKIQKEIMKKKLIILTDFKIFIKKERKFGLEKV